MSIHDLITRTRRRWRYRNVASLADLANLLATRNAARTQPDDPDFRTMTDALVALGRAGFVVVDAGLGGPPISCPDWTLTRRAAVTAFASTETKDWLDEVLCQINWSYGFRVYELHDPNGREHRFSGLPVSRLDGKTNRSVGEQMDAEQIRRLFPVRASVRDELHNGWLITVHDQEWGSSNLFQFLLDAATDRQATSAR